MIDTFIQLHKTADIEVRCATNLLKNDLFILWIYVLMFITYALPQNFLSDKVKIITLVAQSINFIFKQLTLVEFVIFSNSLIWQIFSQNTLKSLIITFTDSLLSPHYQGGIILCSCSMLVLLTLSIAADYKIIFITFLVQQRYHLGTEFSKFFVFTI